MDWLAVFVKWVVVFLVIYLLFMVMVLTFVRWNQKKKSPRFFP
ncbi:MAG: hypothetical protein QJR06_03795 [Alicyclobacillaceae bacterium]|nr:hypothetical protein [Alicyclobacillaceae bacterium]